MPPPWWMRRYLRMTLDVQYKNGKRVAHWNTNAPADEAEALADNEARDCNGYRETTT